MDVNKSWLYTTGNLEIGVPSIFTLQAIDEFNTDMRSGGDLVYLYAEQVCTWEGIDCHLDVTANDNLAGLPQEIQMTDNGDGTYTAPLKVNGVGNLSVSAKVFYEGLMSTYTMGA